MRDLVHIVFYTYSLMLLARIVVSWIPSLYRYRAVDYLVAYTDPYLDIFRRLIPPIGGQIDISPIFAFIVLRILEAITLMAFG